MFFEHMKTENRNGREMKGKGSNDMALVFKLTRTEKGDFQYQL